MKIDKRLFTYIRHMRLYMVALGGLSLLAAALIVLQAYFITTIINGVFLAKETFVEVFKGPALLLLVVIGVRASLFWFHEMLAQRMATRAKTTLRNRLFEHLLRLGPIFMKGERSGELVNTATEGVETLDAYFSQVLPQVCATAIIPLIILVVVFANDLLSGIVLLVTLPILPLFMILIGKQAEAATHKRWYQLSQMSAHFLDVLQGAKILKLFGRNQQQKEMIRQMSDRFGDTTLQVLRIAFLSALVMEMGATISMAIVAVEIGLRLLYGQIPFASAFFVLLLTPEYYQPLRALGPQFHASIASAAGAKRIFDILDTPLATQSPAESEQAEDEESVGTGHASGIAETGDRKGRDGGNPIRTSDRKGREGASPSSTHLQDQPGERCVDDGFTPSRPLRSPDAHHVPPTPLRSPKAHHVPPTPLRSPDAHYAPPTPLRSSDAHHAPPTPLRTGDNPQAEGCPWTGGNPWTEGCSWTGGNPWTESSPRTGSSPVPTITFEGVYYTYGDPEGESHPALKGVSFAMKRGQRVALVGPSGAGKTTIAHLLLRFIEPQQGSIRADGVSIQAFKAQDWRKLVAWQPQHPYLFNTTVVDNIRMGRADASMDEVVAATQKAHIHDIIQSLPQGYHTIVGERGMRLSGGQVQRLSLARAFLKDAPVLILDEATSTLDTETEAHVLDALNTLMQGRMVLIIAHRLNTIRSADQILVLKEGSVIDSGTHTTLIQTSQAYQQLAQAYEDGKIVA